MKLNCPNRLLNQLNLIWLPWFNLSFQDLTWQPIWQRIFLLRKKWRQSTWLYDPKTDSGFAVNSSWLGMVSYWNNVLSDVNGFLPRSSGFSLRPKKWKKLPAHIKFARCFDESPMLQGIYSKINKQMNNT